MFAKRQDIGRVTAPTIECLGPIDERDKAGSILHNYRCECGNTFQTRSYNVKVGRVKSCGCYKKQVAIATCKKMAYKDPTQSSFNGLLRAYKNGAKKRGLVFDLDKSKFRKLTKQDCYYCGTEPTQEHCGADAKEPYVYNGVDRVDNNIGYTAKNSVPCCGICNKMKLTLSYDEFINHIKRIIQKQASDVCS